MLGQRLACGHINERQAQQIFNALVQAVDTHQLWYDVLVTPTGCLGPCGEGPVIVVYPEGVWYVGVQPNDVNEIVEKHMLKGEIVERLRYQWPEQLKH